MTSQISQDSPQKTSLAMILEGISSKRDILDQLEKIESLEEKDPNILDCFHHENPKIAGWSSLQIHEGLTSVS